MQPIEAFPEGEWDFSRIFSMEEPDCTPELLGQCSLPFEHDEERNLTVPSAFYPNLQGNANGSMAGFNESLFFAWNTPNPNLDFVSEYIINSNNRSSDVPVPVSSYHETCGDFNYILATNDNTMSMDICSMVEKNASSFSPVFPDEFAIVENACNNGDISSKKMLDSDTKELHLKRKFDVPEPTTPLGNLKKKPRVIKDAPKAKKNVQSKKNQKVTVPNGNGKEPSNGGPVDGHTTSSYCSEDDNASQDSNGGASSDSKVPQTLNSSGKTRAGRGSATDPQSLYARRRRERINERLRILQNLVPNGTKVDISTMLEEAVHYVKFLQLQIKLLSSDELWMYAPLAYNGIDIGLNQKISMLL